MRNDIEIELTLPALFRLVQEVDDIEGVGVLFLQLVEFFSQENILFGDVRVDESEFRFVRLVRECIGENLV